MTITQNRCDDLLNKRDEKSNIQHQDLQEQLQTMKEKWNDQNDKLKSMTFEVSV